MQVRPQASLYAHLYTCPTRPRAPPQVITSTFDIGPLFVFGRPSILIYNNLSIKDICGPI